MQIKKKTSERTKFENLKAYGKIIVEEWKLIQTFFTHKLSRSLIKRL